MKTGVAYLAVAGAAIISSSVASTLVTQFGVEPVLVVGNGDVDGRACVLRAGSIDGSYAADLLPGFLLIAVGLGFSFVSISIAALAGVHHSEAGLASGLINTSQQIGGALGLAVLATVATTQTTLPPIVAPLFLSRLPTASRRPSWSARDRLRRRAGRSVRGPATGSRPRQRRRRVALGQAFELDEAA